MEGLARTQLFNLVYQMDTSDSIRRATRINELLLEGIEELFFVAGDQSRFYREGVSVSVFNDRVRRNLDIIRNNNDLIITNREEKLLLEVEGLISPERAKTENNKVVLKGIFNKLISTLAKYNTYIFKDYEVSTYMKGNSTELPQVFLSYAYDDKLYTFLLFEYMFQHDIFLFVDWMHNPKIDDGIKLKSALSKELNKSQQLLFMRTHNSELSIPGNQLSLRSWCSWELGNFYDNSVGAEKYLLNLYSIDGFKNPQLHGLNLLTGIRNSRLVGTLIKGE